MTQKEILEGKKLMADLIGMKLEVTQYYNTYEYEWKPPFEHSNLCFEEPPPFEKRWDWQIPVWSKFFVSIHQPNIRSSERLFNEGMNFVDNYTDHMNHNNIENAFETLAGAIHWYNTNKPTTP